MAGGACVAGDCMAGGCAWQGGMHGREGHDRGVCVVGGGMCGGGVHGRDVAGGMHGGGGMHGMQPPPPRQTLRDTVSERAGILLECVLVWVTLHW